MCGCLRLVEGSAGEGEGALWAHHTAVSRWLAVQLHLLYAVAQLHAAVVRHVEFSVKATFPCGCTPIHLFTAEQQLSPGKLLRAAGVGVPCIQLHTA